jgi:hypothetical protein
MSLENHDFFVFLLNRVLKKNLDKYRMFIEISPQSRLRRVDCERTTDYRSRISCLKSNLTFCLVFTAD